MLITVIANLLVDNTVCIIGGSGKSVMTPPSSSLVQVRVTTVLSDSVFLTCVLASPQSGISVSVHHLDKSMALGTLTQSVLLTPKRNLGKGIAY